MLTPTEYVRKPFVVEGVQVDETNIDDVAEWCKGEVTLDSEDPKLEQKYIKVKVHKPLTDKQSRAYPGDWVLQSEQGFKVYTAKAFENSFQLKTEPKISALVD